MSEIAIHSAKEWVDFLNAGDLGSASEMLDITFEDDLDFSETESYPFIGPAAQSKYLYANIDGKGHTFKNLVFNYGKDNQAIFGFKGGSIKNIRFSKNNISGSGYFYLIHSANTSAAPGASRIEDIVVDNDNYFTTGYTSILFGGYTTAVNRVQISGIYNVRGDFNAFYIGNNANINCYVKNSFVAANVTVTGTYYGFNGNKPFYVNCYSKSEITFANGSAKHMPFSGEQYIYFSYSADSISNPEMTKTEYIYGLTNTSADGYVFSSFYDADILPTTANKNYAATTAELQSKEFLVSKGWAVEE